MTWKERPKTMCCWILEGVSLCVMLLAVFSVQVEADEDTALPLWTIQGCPLPSSPHLHPVGVYQHNWLNLEKQSKLSDAFWFMVYGSTHNLEACGLRSGLLYHVSRHNATAFAFRAEEGEARGSICRDERFLVLEKGSYGFVSCEDTRGKATLEAGLWWQSIPISYIATVLICVGVAMGVVTVVGVAAGVVLRRRASGRAALG